MKKLTRKAALALAARRFPGESVYIGDEIRKRGQSSAALRAGAQAAMLEMEANKPRFPELHEWPAETTIGEYREALTLARKAQREWKSRHDWLWSNSMYYRFRIVTGRTLGMVRGQGDTLEEALRAAGVSLAGKVVMDGY